MKWELHPQEHPGRRAFSLGYKITGTGRQVIRPQARASELWSQFQVPCDVKSHDRRSDGRTAGMVLHTSTPRRYGVSEEPVQSNHHISSYARTLTGPYNYSHMEALWMLPWKDFHGFNRFSQPPTV